MHYSWKINFRAVYLSSNIKYSPIKATCARLVASTSGNCNYQLIMSWPLS